MPSQPPGFVRLEFNRLSSVQRQFARRARARADPGGRLDVLAAGVGVSGDPEEPDTPGPESLLAAPFRNTTIPKFAALLANVELALCLRCFGQEARQQQRPLLNTRSDATPAELRAWRQLGARATARASRQARPDPEELRLRAKIGRQARAVRRLVGDARRACLEVLERFQPEPKLLERRRALGAELERLCARIGHASPTACLGGGGPQVTCQLTASDLREWRGSLGDELLPEPFGTRLDGLADRWAQLNPAREPAFAAALGQCARLVHKAEERTLAYADRADALYAQLPKGPAAVERLVTVMLAWGSAVRFRPEANA